MVMNALLYLCIVTVHAELCPQVINRCYHEAIAVKEYCTELNKCERIILEHHALCHYNGKGRDVLDGYLPLTHSLA